MASAMIAKTMRMVHNIEVSLGRCTGLVPTVGGAQASAPGPPRHRDPGAFDQRTHVPRIRTMTKPAGARTARRAPSPW